MGHVADGGQQGRVDHGGADPEQDRGGCPGQEAAGQGGAGQRDRLQQHPASDQGLAAEPIRQGTSDQLAEAPDGRIQRSQQADLGDGEAATDEQQGQQPPREPVVEVVDQPGLAAGRQGWLAEAGADKDFAGGGPFNAGCTQRSVAGSGLATRVQPGSVSQASSWAWPGSRGPPAPTTPGRGRRRPGRGRTVRAQPGVGGDQAGEVGGEGDGEVAGGLVQAHGQPAALRAGEVDLHDHRGRPAQPLVDPEQDVGGDDPAQVGAQMISRGTGRPTSQPATRTGLRP